MAGWSTIKPKTGSENLPRLDTLVRMLDLSKYPGEWVEIRAIGPVLSYALHWLEFTKNDGTTVRIPKLCYNYDHESEEFKSNGCPWCESPFPGRQNYISNVIVRALEENMPKNISIREKEKKVVNWNGHKCCLLERGSKSWSPAQVINVPPTAAGGIASLKEFNVWVKKGEVFTPAKKNSPGGETFEISDIKYGMDISVKYDPKAAGTAKYAFQAGDRIALTREELLFPLNDLRLPEYLTAPVENLQALIEAAVKEYERSKDRLVVKEEEEKPKGKSGGGGKTSGKSDKISTAKKTFKKEEDEDSNDVPFDEDDSDEVKADAEDSSVDLDSDDDDDFDIDKVINDSKKSSSKKPEKTKPAVTKTVAKTTKPAAGAGTKKPASGLKGLGAALKKTAK